ncbi:MAG: hypothetical protein SOZ59_05705, partial [Candidatus Limivivens sp.]|nr:hypothetical protein [Candidatus Limivivens sp.]
MSAGNSFELPAAFFIGNIVTVQKPLSAFIFKYCLKHGSDKRLDEKQLREKGKWKIQTHQFDPVCKQSKQM